MLHDQPVASTSSANVFSFKNSTLDEVLEDLSRFADINSDATWIHCDLLDRPSSFIAIAQSFHSQLAGRGVGLCRTHMFSSWTSVSFQPPILPERSQGLKGVSMMLVIGTMKISSEKKNPRSHLWLSRRFPDISFTPVHYYNIGLEIMIKRFKTFWPIKLLYLSVALSCWTPLGQKWVSGACSPRQNAS